jgi:hypothetical protein
MDAHAPVLTDRALNRALLARQGLLQPWDVPVETALHRLIGVQSQAPQAGYTALWARLASFDPAQLSDLIERRTAVRIALLRGTLFLVTAEDALALRPLLQPVMQRAIASTSGRRTADVSASSLIQAAGALMAERPRTFAELGTELAEIFPGYQAADLQRRARTDLALVQVPPRGLWQRSGPPAHVTLQAWLDRPVQDVADLATLLRRYLTAFGPATVADITAWSGLTGIRTAIEAVRPQLRTFRSERGQELFDVPDGLLPPADTPVGVRILGEFDNLLLSHADRSRIFDDSTRYRFMTQNGLIRSTLLLDGFVAGVCTMRTGARGTTLHVEPFAPLAAREVRAVRAEAERLLQLFGPAAAGTVVIA